MMLWGVLAAVEIASGGTRKQVFLVLWCPGTESVTEYLPEDSPQGLNKSCLRS